MAELDKAGHDAITMWTARYRAWEAFAKDQRDKWDRYYKIYRCYAEGRKDNLSNLFIPFIFSLIETIEPRLVEAFISTKPWVGVLPVGPEDVPAAKAMGDLLQWQLEERIDFPTKMASWLKSCLIYGTSIGMVTWRLEQIERQKLSQVNIRLPGGFSVALWAGKQPVKETVYDDNDFQHIDLYSFFFEPRAQSVEDALYCGHLSYENLDFLKRMEAEGLYQNVDLVEKSGTQEDSPMFKRLNNMGLGTASNVVQADPRSRIYELMHCWENDRYTVICNREVVLRDGSNPYYHKRKPYVKITDIPIPHEFYGMGEIEPAEFLQYGINDLTNAQIDYLMMSILGVFLVDETSRLTTADLKLHPRKIIRVSEQDNLRPWQMPPLDPAAFQMPSVLKMYIENAVGASDVPRGMPMPKGATATEVSTVQQMAEARFRLKIRLINQAGIRHIARLMAWNNQQFIRQPKIIRLLGEDGMAFPSFTPELLQGNFDFLPAGVAEEPLVAKENRRNNMMLFYQLAKDDPMWKQRELRKRVAEALEIKDVDAVLKTDEEIAQEQAAMQAQQAAMMVAQSQQPAPAGVSGPQPPGFEQMLGGMQNGGGR